MSIFHFRALYKVSSDAGVLSSHYRNISCFVCYRNTVEVHSVYTPVMSEYTCTNTHLFCILLLVPSVH